MLHEPFLNHSRNIADCSRNSKDRNVTTPNPTIIPLLFLKIELVDMPTNPNTHNKNPTDT
jgi:hypothetical protein